MRKVEGLPTRECEAGYGPDEYTQKCKVTAIQGYYGESMVMKVVQCGSG